MVSWCKQNDLVLNVSKTKEVIVDFRRAPGPIAPLIINNENVEIVESFKFLGSIISQDIGWDAHVMAIRKKAQQRLYFLRQLRKFGVREVILIQFYRSIIESVLSFSITAWYGSTTVQEQQDLHRVVRTASKIIGCELPSLDTIFEKRLIRKARNIVKDDTHPAHPLFQLLPSGKHYRAILFQIRKTSEVFLS